MIRLLRRETNQGDKMIKIDHARMQANRKGKKIMTERAALSPEARAKIASREREEIDNFIESNGIVHYPSSRAGGSQYSSMLGTDL